MAATRITGGTVGHLIVKDWADADAQYRTALLPADNPARKAMIKSQADAIENFLYCHIWSAVTDELRRRWREQE